MKPCLSVRYLLRLAVWEARALLCISRALRWKAEWPELARDYLRDARTWGRLLNCSTAAFAEHDAATCVWLTKRNQSALEVCA
jgi:hypothetical protein